MNRVSLIIILLTVVPAMAYAGHGTIREDDSHCIVEYEGDVDEVIAANILKDKEEKLKLREEEAKAKEAERIRTLARNHAEQTEKRRARFKEGVED